MKTLHIVIIMGIVVSATIVLFFILTIQNEPILPQECSGSESTNCIYSFGMWLDNKNRNYNAFPITSQVNKPVEFDSVIFSYTGSSTPDIDGINCDNVFPRAINSTTGHHLPLIVNYDGYFKINETRHFTTTLANGQTKYLTLCWNYNAQPRVRAMSDSGLGGPMFCPQKTSWFDDNKTAGIIQDEYCSPNSPAYDRYIAEVR
ncbi:MAG: hypothetical protein ACREBJ_09950 [Nitrosotalea sp.]